MHDWLVLATEQVVVLINFIALGVILFATLQALAGGLQLLRRSDDGLRADTWLRFGRWLVGGLTFQLAADIVETAITEDWESIARLAAVAVIRTFLNYFLERDIVELRERKERKERGRREPTEPTE